MKRSIIMLCALFFYAAISVVEAPVAHAQTAEETEDIQEQHENSDPVDVIYYETEAGDQYLRIALAPGFPLNFGNPFTDDGKLKVGGAASLGYHYFLFTNFAVGADVAFGFNVTLGGNIFNYVPILATATYQFSIKNFEIPITLGVGMAWETYGNKTYWPGLVVKPQVGLHYRIGASWSVGGDISYSWMPEFLHLYDSSKQDIHGQFLSIDLVARYYF